MSTEAMRSVVGYEGLFGVGAEGSIYSYRSSRMLAVQKTAKGYLKTSFTRLGVKRDVLVHRVVAEAWIANPDDKPFVNHKNGVKTDNRVENLEWVTASENLNHAWQNGLMPVTAAMREQARRAGWTQAKVTAEQCRVISRMAAGGVPQNDIAAQFNISQPSVSRIAKQYQGEAK